MALVVLCGQPSSGKTTLCERLVEVLSSRGVSIIPVSVDRHLSVDKNEAYEGSAAHKNTRSGLRSAVERELANRSAVVVVDALNNIKVVGVWSPNWQRCCVLQGCRYEIWCLARAAATKYCLVHLEAEAEICRQRNAVSPNPYRPEIFEDLWPAFERPDSRNRWEAPLYTVHTDRAPDGREVEAAVTSIADWICGDCKQEKTARTALEPTDATSNPPLAQTNLQHDIDKAANDIVSRLISAQKEAGSDAVGTVSFEDGLPSLHLQRAVTVAGMATKRLGQDMDFVAVES